MFLEIELKLSIDQNPAHVALLFNHPLLKNSHPFTQELISRYFDTAHLSLWKQGLSLRVRETDGRMIQTLKNAGEQLNELQYRHEWDQPIENKSPEIFAFQDRAISKKLETILGEEPLIELFYTQFVRTQWCLETETNTKIELVLDQGRITAANQHRPLHEIELELKQGDVNEIKRIADLLRQTIPLTLETHSKAERGYQLYTKTLSGSGIIPVI